MFRSRSSCIFRFSSPRSTARFVSWSNWKVRLWVVAPFFSVSIAWVPHILDASSVPSLSHLKLHLVSSQAPSRLISIHLHPPPSTFIHIQSLSRSTRPTLTISPPSTSIRQLAFCNSHLLQLRTLDVLVLLDVFVPTAAALARRRSAGVSSALASARGRRWMRDGGTNERNDGAGGISVG